jgi:hypothetical protein
MMKINTDTIGIKSVQLEIQPDGKYRALVIGPNQHPDKLIYNIRGNNVSNNDYLYRFNNINDEYVIVLYEQMGSFSHVNPKLLSDTSKSIGEHLLNSKLIEQMIVLVPGTHLAYDRYNSIDEVTFKKDSNLSDHERKYCSCIVKVGSKGGAKNKYAICAHSTGTTSRNCFENYDLNRMPDDYRNEAIGHKK